VEAGGLVSDVGPFFENFEILKDQHWIMESFRGRGNLEFRGQFRFSGEWTGSIRSEEKSHLYLMREARVKGTIECDELTVEGSILDADVKARNVRLLPGAKVIGRVQAERISVEPGAILEGRLASIPSRPAVSPEAKP